MSKKKKRSSKSKRWKIIVIIEVLLILILIPVVFIFAKLSLVNTASTADVDPANIIINEDVDTATQEILTGYRNIAFFGVDSRDGTLDSGTRSDSIMIVSINQETKDIKVLSIYRDTCLYVPGYGYTKATHAYAYGGAELAISMLNINFDLDITEFATVDFGVLADIIDALGGLEIEITEAELSVINGLITEQNNATGSSSERLTSSGLQLLDGTQATAYARIRKIDSDFKRAERQRTVLAKIFEKAQSASLTTLLGMVDTVLPEIYTNLTSTEMIVLAKDVFSYSLTDSSGFPFNLTTGYLNSLSYVFAKDFEQNVIDLHAYLFDNEEYTPSSTVSSISAELKEKTGY